MNAVEIAIKMETDAIDFYKTASESWRAEPPGSKQSPRFEVFCPD